ncbi:Sel1 repeat protein, partial [Polychytrium aggregatum]|uniref:Sel1 repeat protein n=1 Tax=Polychytrium aggregatum TaxID=110093 RepID=UPI0022FF0979
MAQFQIAERYINGIDCYHDYAKAAELYRKLAELGIPQAQNTLGRCYESGEGVKQDFNTALEWFSKAADQGSHSDSKSCIGSCYYYGQGVSKDWKKASEWYSKSADQGKP